MDGVSRADLSTWLPGHAAGIEHAAIRIAGLVRHTPLLPCDLGSGVLLKPENLQVTGAFKARGTANAVLALQERDPSVTAVAAVSSGNHAQAVAWAAARAGLRATIVIPADASPAKIAATRAFGAEVICDGVTWANREEVVQEVARERGLPLIHPFDDWDVIHGQGTAAREVLTDAPGVRCIATPVGGGGLISGTALIARHLAPGTRVIGVEPETASDAARSLHTGSLQTLDAAPQTIADGVRVRSIGRRPFEVIVEHGLVEDIVTVGDREIEEATVYAWRRLHLAIEPTAALPIAALLADRLPHGDDDAPTVLVLSGGNFSSSVVASLLSRG